jgi:hypothetical protein
MIDCQSVITAKACKQLTHGYTTRKSRDGFPATFDCPANLCDEFSVLILCITSLALSNLLLKFYSSPNWQYKKLFFGVKH